MRREKKKKSLVPRPDVLVTVSLTLLVLGPAFDLLISDILSQTSLFP